MKLRRLVIIGQGGHGRDCAEIAARAGYRRVALASDPEIPHGHRYVIGINDPRTRWNRWVNDWRVPSAFARIADPTATVGSRCGIGHGCVIGPNALLLRGVALYEHVHVGYGAQMTRTTIGSCTTIAPGAVICGDVKIGRRCLIGAGAVIKNLVTIGDDVTVGAGAVVINDIPDGVTVKGVPAR